MRVQTLDARKLSLNYKITSQHVFKSLMFRNLLLGSVLASKLKHIFQESGKKQTLLYLCFKKFTNLSVAISKSSFRIHISSRYTTLSGRISHTECYTVPELASIRAAIRYVISYPPNDWCIFSNSQFALEALACSSKLGIDYQLIVKSYGAFQEAMLFDPTIVLQSIRSHCGIRGNVLADSAVTAAHQHSTRQILHFCN